MLAALFLLFLLCFIRCLFVVCGCAATLALVSHEVFTGRGGDAGVPDIVKFILTPLPPKLLLHITPLIILPIPTLLLSRHLAHPRPPFILLLTTIRSISCRLLRAVCGRVVAQILIRFYRFVGLVDHLIFHFLLLLLLEEVGGDATPNTQYYH